MHVFIKITAVEGIKVKTPVQVRYPVHTVFFCLSFCLCVIVVELVLQYSLTNW